jgi:CRP-like cAMP-binding protein
MPTEPRNPSLDEAAEAESRANRTVAELQAEVAAARLAEALEGDLGGLCQRRSWPARSRIWAQGSDSKEFLLLLSGSIEEWNHSGRVSVRAPNDLIGEVEVFTPGIVPRSCAVTVAQRAEVLHVSHEAAERLSPELMGEVVQRMASHAYAQLQSTGLENQGQLKTEFPGQRGMLLPGPYQGNNCLLHIFLVDYPSPERELFRRTMPPGMKPHPGYNFFLLVHSQLEDFHHKVAHTHSYPYDELGIMVPVEVEGRLRFYIPYLFPDNLMAIFGGREVYGLQKMHMPSYTDWYLKRLLSYDKGEFVVDVGYEVEKLQDADLGELRELIRDLFNLGELGGSLGREDWEDSGSHAMHLGALMAGLLDNPLTSVATSLLNRFDDGETARRAKGALLHELLEQTNSWLASHHEADLTCLPSVGWKRIYNHSAQMDRPDKMAWRPEHFQVDELISYPFAIQKVHRVELLRPQHFEVADSLIGRPFPKPRPLGLRIVVDMDMGRGETLVDYRERYGEEPPALGTPVGEALAWGPAAWEG